jgi:hypothetical protein
MILGAVLATEINLQSPGLHAHLTTFSSVSSVDINVKALETRITPLQYVTQRICGSELLEGNESLTFSLV